MRRWANTISMAVCGLAIAAMEFAFHDLVAGVAVLVFFALVAVVVSPRAFPRSVTAAEAQATGHPIVYWRPGCPYCIRLRARLGRDARKLTWVDIWSDPAGAAAVRAITGGNETVPTLVAGADSWVNPSPAKAREIANSTASY